MLHEANLGVLGSVRVSNSDVVLHMMHILIENI